MHGRTSEGIARGVQRLYDEGTVSGLGEASLLGRFLDRGDAVAFEALVTRHGPTVLSVCRRVLRDPSAADDAFQATFLLLVRKARTLRAPELLGPWLHRVAYRVAIRAAKSEAKRRAREIPSADGLDRNPAPEPPGRDLHRAVHEALDGLPEKYRAPLVLCYLEGRTHDEAALRLRWPVGSVKGRLSRGRELLKSRLERRGVTSTAGAVAALLTAEAASAACTAPLITRTISAATAFAAGKAGSLAAGSASAAALLAEEAARAMTIKKCATLAATCAAVFLTAGGAAVLARQDAERPSAPTQATSKGANEARIDTQGDALARLQGTWNFEDVESNGQGVDLGTLKEAMQGERWKEYGRDGILEQLTFRGNSITARFLDGIERPLGTFTLKLAEAPHLICFQAKGTDLSPPERWSYRVLEASLRIERMPDRPEPSPVGTLKPPTAGDGRRVVNFKRQLDSPLPQPFPSIPPLNDADAATAPPAESPSAPKVLGVAIKTGAQLAEEWDLQARNRAEDREELSARIEGLETDLSELRNQETTLRNIVAATRLYEAAEVATPGAIVDSDPDRLRERLKKVEKILAETKERIERVHNSLSEARGDTETLNRQIGELTEKAAAARARPGKPNTVQVGDTIVVEVLEALPGRPITGERLVRPDGTISLEFYGDIHVDGLTRKEIKERLVAHMRKYLTDEALGLIGEDAEKPGEYSRIAPADSDRVSVDDTQYPRQAEENRLNRLEKKLDATLSELNSRKAAPAGPSRRRNDPKGPPALPAPNPASDDRHTLPDELRPPSPKN